MTRKRARTGCLNCRKKHKKCDESKPSCNLCIKRNETCEWPLKSGRFNKNSIKVMSSVTKISKPNPTVITFPDDDKYIYESTSDSYESNGRQFKHSNFRTEPSLKETPENTSVMEEDQGFRDSVSREKSPGLFVNVHQRDGHSLLDRDSITRFSDARSGNENSKVESMNLESKTSLGSISDYQDEGNTPVSEKTYMNENSSNTSYHSLVHPIEHSSQKSSKISLNSILNNNNINDDDITFGERSGRFQSALLNNDTAENKVGLDCVASISRMSSESLSESVHMSNRGSDMDHFHSNASKESDSYLSPDSIMSPFMNQNNLNSTLRDYIFTNVVTAPDLNNEFAITADFNNILHSPVQNSFTVANSNKNLRELVNTKNKDSSIKDESNDNKVNTTSKEMHNDISLSNEERMNLLKNYLYEIAPWLDMFDIRKHFGFKITELAQQNEALLYALYAISARQKEQTPPGYSSELTIKLYQESLNRLIPTVSQTMNKAMICTCVILCVFEMMASSPKEWRHHLEGCCALFKANNINGFSENLERALFWCYARMDVSSAVIGEQPTICASEYWIPKGYSVRDSRTLFSTSEDEDLYSNYIVFLCSRVLNLIATDTETFKDDWEFLWKEVVDWYTDRPVAMKQVLEYEDKPFPGILFLNGPAISANQLYHMAIILLIQNKPRRYKITTSDSVKSTIWHAKQICGISIHNTHHGCWNNALQPLWIAGKLLSSDYEHEIILKLLEKIETTTGWQMKFRAFDLKKYWSGLMGY